MRYCGMMHSMAAKKDRQIVGSFSKGLFQPDLPCLHIVCEPCRCRQKRSRLFERHKPIRSVKGGPKLQQAHWYILHMAYKTLAITRQKPCKNVCLVCKFYFPVNIQNQTNPKVECSSQICNSVRKAPIINHKICIMFLLFFS